MLDTDAKCAEFYTRYTAWQAMPDDEGDTAARKARAKAFAELGVWIYRNCGREMLEAVINKELKDDTSRVVKALAVAATISAAMKEEAQVVAQVEAMD